MVSSTYISTTTMGGGKSKEQQQISIDTLVEGIHHKDEQITISCIRKLCRICSEQQRCLSLVSSPADVVTPVIQCLEQSKPGPLRHSTLILLSMLLSPYTNKRIITYRHDFDQLIRILCKILLENYDETTTTITTCMCLMNLAMFEPASIKILQHSTTNVIHHKRSCITTLFKENEPDSFPFLHALEKLFIKSTITSTTFGIKKQSRGLKLSKESLPWLCGLIQKLTVCETNASIVSIETPGITKRVVKILSQTQTDPTTWTENSLEDFLLSIVVTLSQCKDARQDLIQAGTIKILEPILLKDNRGRQGFKAAIALSFLEVDFNNDDIAELVCKIVLRHYRNVVERHTNAGGRYYSVSNNDGDLYQINTAVGALEMILISATKKNKTVPLSTLTSPTTLAASLVLLSNYTKTNNNNNRSQSLSSSMTSTSCIQKSSSSSSSSDPKTTTMSILHIIEYMLPLILKKIDYDDKDGDDITKQAVNEICSLLLLLVDHDTIMTEDAKLSANRAVEILVESCDGSVRPLLESAHLLWSRQHLLWSRQH